ncbi:MAG: hypothetical protein V4654_14025 [Bdellovibrionota bacterium]
MQFIYFFLGISTIANIYLYKKSASAISQVQVEDEFHKHNQCEAETVEYEKKRFDGLAPKLKAFASEYKVIRRFDKPPQDTSNFSEIISAYEKFLATQERPADKGIVLEGDPKQPLSETVLLKFRDQESYDCLGVDACFHNPRNPDPYLDIGYSQPMRHYEFPVLRLEEKNSGFEGDYIVVFEAKKIAISKNSWQVESLYLKFKLHKLEENYIYIEWINEGFKPKVDHPYRKDFIALLKRVHPDADMDLMENLYYANASRDHCYKLFYPN